MEQVKPTSTFQAYRVLLFCLDFEASKTAVFLLLNRNTVNRHSTLFRRMIFLHRLTQLRRFVGVVEADESYFGPAQYLLGKPARSD